MDKVEMVCIGLTPALAYLRLKDPRIFDPFHYTVYMTVLVGDR